MKGERKKRGRGRESTQTGGPEKSSEKRRGLEEAGGPQLVREGRRGNRSKSSTEEQGGGAALSTLLVPSAWHRAGGQYVFVE